GIGNAARTSSRRKRSGGRAPSSQHPIPRGRMQHDDRERAERDEQKQIRGPVDPGAAGEVAGEELEPVVEIAVDAPGREREREQREAERDPDGDEPVTHREQRYGDVAQAHGTRDGEQDARVDEPEQDEEADRYAELQCLEQSQPCRQSHRRRRLMAGRFGARQSPRRGKIEALVLAPKLFEPCRAAAGELVEVVPERVALVVILMVVLGRVELRRRHDLRDDLAGERAALLESLLRALRELALLLVVVEDRAAVLIASIAELSAAADRIDVTPEHVEKQLVVHDVGSVLVLHGFGVARVTPRHLLVRRVRHVPANVPRRGGEHAFNLVESLLDAPEASARERRDGRGIRVLLRAERCDEDRGGGEQYVQQTFHIASPRRRRCTRGAPARAPAAGIREYARLDYGGSRRLGCQGRRSRYTFDLRGSSPAASLITSSTSPWARRTACSTRGSSSSKGASIRHAIPVPLLS